MIFDTHAHYDDERFQEDREAVIEELRDNEVIAVINCGSSFEGTLASIELAKKYDFFYAAIGIHPECANEFSEEVYNELKKMANNQKIKAIGEIGLDYYWEENPPKDIQIKVMREQMELAREMKLPVVIHDREAHEDVLNIIKDYPEVKGVIHSFSGSVEFAKECIKQGYYIGFTGVITFKNAKKIKDVAKEIPLNRILVETDCPYMTPEPHRGKRNRSDYIPNIIKTIAELREVSFKDIEEASIKNAKKLFDVKLSSL
jgi:TatD DNase family protein